MTSVHLSDREAIAMCPRGLDIRATAGRAILWFLPYRRSSGVLELPDTAKPEPVEAIVIHDNGENGLSEGVMVGAKRSGEYFEYQGHRLCSIDSSDIILVDTKFSPEE